MNTKLTKLMWIHIYFTISRTFVQKPTDYPDFKKVLNMLHSPLKIGYGSSLPKTLSIYPHNKVSGNTFRLNFLP